jgi:hypothetical protein
MEVTTTATPMAVPTITAALAIANILPPAVM